jgi:hypothetical protein
VAPPNDQPVRLARKLRDLRISTWPDHELTQAQLAKALSSEGRVAGATLSSWESTTSPKKIPTTRLNAYARFFCTQRSLEGEPHLISEDELEPAEVKQFQKLEAELLELLNPTRGAAQHSFRFDAGPIVVICPDAPAEARGPLADAQNPNFTRLQKYGDLDALIELYGHIRAENPTLEVFHPLASEVKSDDLSTHVILIGGIAWNEVTRSIQDAISQGPIKQTDVDDLKGGDIFRVGTSGGVESFYPKYADKKLIADVGYLARLRNPFNFSRTLIVCNGIYSRGVLGAVRCLTDARVREENEKYLAKRFPKGEFVMLLRVLVVGEKTMSPDLQNPDVRLYEWAPGPEDHR